MHVEYRYGEKFAEFLHEKKKRKRSHCRKKVGMDFNEFQLFKKFTKVLKEFIGIHTF